MDPISIATTVGSVVMTCAKVAKTINDLVGKYNDRPMTMTAIATECSVLTAALSHIQTLATQNPDSLSSRLNSQSNLAATFDTAISGCAVVISVLDREIQSILKGGDPGDIDRLGRAKAMWKEDTLKELLQQLRGQQIAINLLLTALQSESISEIRDILQKNNGVIQNVFRRTNTLRITHSPSPVNQTGQNNAGLSSALSTLSLGSIQTSFNPTAQDLDLLNGTGRLHETTPFLAFSMAKAVKDNDTKTIEKLLSRDYDVNFPAPGGLRPLLVAAQNGSLSLVRRFLDAGAKVHAVDHESKTALLWAAENGNEEMAELLINQGASIEARGKDGMSVVTQASFSGRVEIVKLLIKHHADIESQDDDMMNPLHNAAQFGHYSVMQTLLQNGAKVDVPDKDQTTALLWASRTNNSAAVDLLVLYGADIEAKDKYWYTPLHEATFKNDLDSMMVLIRSGATVDAKSDQGFTPLHLAARDGYLEAVEILIQRKASLTAQTKAGDAPIHWAASKGNAKIIECLIKNGADTTQANESGHTALHVATAEGQETAVDALLKGGADIKSLSKGEDPRPPIFDAIFGKKTKMVEYLIQRGSPIDVKATKDQITLLHQAAKMGLEDIVELLLQKRMPIDIKDLHLRTPLHWAAAGNNSNSDNSKIVRLLLGRKASISAKDEDGSTALHIAAAAKQVEPAKILLEHKARVYATDNEEHTPLHIACISGCVELVEILVQRYNASVRAKDKFDNTPLHLAERPEVVDILMRNRAKAEVKNKWHQTPLHIYACNGHLETARMLVRRGAAVDGVDHEKVTPLIRAVFEDKIEMVKLFLELNASTDHRVGGDKSAALHLAAERNAADIISAILDCDIGVANPRTNINIRNATNETPLYVAVDNKKPEAAKLLISRGAWLEPVSSQRNSVGATPLILASASGEWNIVRALVNKGADVRVKTTDRGMTALHYSVAQGDLDTVKLLIGKGASIRDQDKAGFTPLEYAERWAPTSPVVGYLRKLES